LWLQIRSISSAAKRECTAPPYSFIAIQARTFAHAKALFFIPGAILRDEVLALNFASRTEVVGNNLALARSIW
jgi:hypothetical protein